MSSIYSQFEDSDFIRETARQIQQTAGSSYDSFPQTLHFQSSNRRMLRDVNLIFKQKMHQMESIFRKTLQSITKSEKNTSNKNRDSSGKGIFYQNNGKAFLEFTNSTALENILDITPIHAASIQDLTQQTSDEILINQKKISDQIGNMSKIISKTYKSIDLLNFPQACTNIDWSYLKPSRKIEKSYIQLYRTNTSTQNLQESYIVYTQQQTSRRQNAGNLVSCKSSAIKRKKKLQRQGNQQRNLKYSSEQIEKFKKQSLNKIKDRIQTSPHTIGHSAGASHLLKRLSRQKNERQALINKIKLKLK